MNPNYFIGLDIGGTFIKGAALSPQGRVLNRSRRGTESKASNPVILGNIHRVIRDLMKARSRKPLAVGMGVPGAIQFERGVVSRSPHFPNWINFDLRAALAEEIRLPLFIDNDANCAALGELWMGGGSECSNFCLLTLGTGVGGGLILGKEIFRGMDGMAAEVGHLIVEPEGKPCGCGGRGCLEKYISAHSAVEQVMEKYDSAEAENIRKATHGRNERVTAKMIYDLAKQGDSFCLAIFRDMGRYLGIGFVDLIHIFNLEKIIIGGAMMSAWDLLILPAVREMKSRSYQVPAERVRVVPAECGEDAGVLGAAYLAKTGIGPASVE